MKALVGAFNQEKALIGAFSVILKTDGSFAALILTLRPSDECYGIKSEAGAGWRELEKVPRFLYNSAVATLANTAYLIGGFEEEPVDSVLSYTGDTDTWAEATKLRWSYNKAKLRQALAFCL